MCEEKIDNKVASYTTVLLATVFILLGYYLLKNYLFVIHGKQKPAVDKNAKLVSFKLFAKVLMKYRIQTYCIKAARKILWSSDKSLQEQVCALHRLLLPGKDHNAWPAKDQRQLLLLSGSSTEKNEEVETEDEDEDEEEEWVDDDEEDNDDEHDDEEEEEKEEKVIKPNARSSRTQKR